MRLKSSAALRQHFYQEHFPDLLDFVHERSWLSMDDFHFYAETNTGKRTIRISDLIRSKDWRKCLEDYLSLRNNGIYYKEHRRDVYKSTQVN